MVEDEDAVRSLIRKVLESNGYTILEASGPVQALLLCEQYEMPIHMLLTDVVMPQMSGCELAEHLARSRPDMKILYISGYTDNAIAHLGVLEPGVPFLQKPFTPDRLARKVRETLDAV